MKSKQKTDGKYEGVLKLMDQQDSQVREACKKFYPAGSIAEFRFSSDQDTIKDLSVKTGTLDTSLSLKLEQEQLEDIALSIQSNVKQGKPNNIEIRLDQGFQLCDGRKYPLANTAVRILREKDSSPKCIFIQNDDRLDVRVFIGGDNVVAVMAVKCENGEIAYAKLSELHLLSIQENPDPRKEVGLLTSYVLLTAKVYFSIIMALSLDPIKNLLLSECLKAEWQRAKDAREQSSKELSGGDANG